MQYMHRAFDCGLITVTPDYKIRLSSRLEKLSHTPGIKEQFLKYKDATISVPRRFAPDSVFLEFHNKNIFRS